ncbi:hypothetical protein FXO37_10939 [Capsicum annuum]|nr:hypothetical protein FXO37_10939 [Capsicum annuum]
MRGKQLAYVDAYNATGRIIDLNFYNNFKDRYDDLRKLADSGGLRFNKLFSIFQLDEEVVKYVRRNMEVKHFLVVEILLYEGNIKVYDCNLSIFSEDKFLIHMQPILKLLPKLLTQTKLMDHFPVEVLRKE